MSLLTAFGSAYDADLISHVPPFRLIVSLRGRFLHEAEVEANQKQAEMDEPTNAQKVRGH